MSGSAVLGDILYSTKPFGQGPDTVVAMDPTGTRPLRTIVIGGWHPDLRPDGSLITFASFPAGSDTFDIFTMCPDGSNATRLTDDDFPAFHPRWSPDGTKVTYNGFPGEIWVVNADGSGGMRVATNSQFGSWSPDGTRFAWGGKKSSADNNDDIWVGSPDGTNARNVTNSPGNDEFPSWSPDGSKIAFSNDASGNSDIFLMDADGSNVTQLTNDPAFEDAEQWSPDGTQIAYERREHQDGWTDIWLMNADGSSQRNLTNSPDASDDMPSWR